MGAIASVRVDLSDLRAENLLRETGAFDKCMDFLLDKSRDKAPVYDGWAGPTGHASGFLRENGRVVKISDTWAMVIFDAVYAAKQENRQWQKHPAGGQAKFLADTWEFDMGDALGILIDTMTEGG